MKVAARPRSSRRQATRASRPDELGRPEFAADDDDWAGSEGLVWAALPDDGLQRLCTGLVVPKFVSS